MINPKRRLQKPEPMCYVGTMSPGDLVRVNSRWSTETLWLYGGDDVPWDEFDTLIPSDVPIGPQDVGTIICHVADPVPGGGKLFKLITSRGGGWATTAGWS